MNNYILYMHTTPSSKVYIGITCQSINKRWKNGKGYIGCTAFYRAIEKYGWNNIEHKILLTGLSKNDACELEKEYINKYDSSNPLKGYNLTSGGEHCEQTKQSRKQLSDSLKQYYANNPNAKNRISEQLRTRPVSEETKCKMSESRKKYLIENPDARKKCGDSFRGKHRVLTNQDKRKPVRCVDTNEIYVSITMASKELNVSRNGISNVLSGKSKTCGGYKFEYV